MALINVATREIHCKLVYYGPGLSGKKPNLKYTYSTVPGQARGALLSIASGTDRSLFFDLLSIVLATVCAQQVHVHLHTLHRRLLHEAPR